ncbi:MAG: sulfite exporter TauE/SafE family protein, partial [Acidimicrobiales bacterium]
MEFSLAAVISGLAVGLVVGTTGSGGGALLTPLLILALHVDAKTAVASDLVASVFMRPVAGFVHLRRNVVHWGIVGWLVLGSTPAAFAAGVVSSLLIPTSVADRVLEPVIGGVLLISGAAAIARRAAPSRPTRRGATLASIRPRPLPTALIGVAGGLAVGVTSVGAGTLMLVGLALAYPALTASELVGTDLVQAVPLVLAAALGHLVAGGLHVSLTAAVIAGGVPGAFFGAYLSRWVPARALGVVVASVIFGSGCALVGWIPGSIVGGGAATLLAAVTWARRRGVT